METVSPCLFYLVMRKFFILALIAITCSVSAQKLSKEEKAAKKAAEAAQTAALVQELFSEHCFKFIPESYTLGNGERTNIGDYQELAIRPDSFRCVILGIDPIETNRYEVVKETTEKTGYTLSVKLEANGEILTFNFVVNSKTALGTCKVKSNQCSDRTYSGEYKSF